VSFAGHLNTRDTWPKISILVWLGLGLKKFVVCSLRLPVSFCLYFIFFGALRPHVRSLRNPTRLAGVVKLQVLKKRSPKSKSEKSTQRASQPASQPVSQPSAFGPGLQMQLGDPSSVYTRAYTQYEGVHQCGNE